MVPLQGKAMSIPHETSKFHLPKIHYNRGQIWMQILCSKSKYYVKCWWIWFEFCEVCSVLKMKCVPVRDKCTRYIGLMNIPTLNQNGKLKPGLCCHLNVFHKIRAWASCLRLRLFLGNLNPAFIGRICQF